MWNPINLFLGFRGRIGRFAYWFGLIVLIAVSPFSFWAVFSDNPFEEAILLTRQTGVGGLAWSIALLLPLAALNTKRLHETGLLGLLFYAPAALTAASFFTGWRPQIDQALWVTQILGWWTGAAGIWFLVRLGLYRGTPGPNKYGAPPG